MMMVMIMVKKKTLINLHGKDNLNKIIKYLYIYFICRYNTLAISPCLPPLPLSFPSYSLKTPTALCFPSSSLVVPSVLRRGLGKGESKAWDLIDNFAYDNNDK